MKSLRFIEDGTLYVIMLDSTISGHELSSCWRFYPGRTVADKIALSALPWFARQKICELLNDTMP